MFASGWCKSLRRTNTMVGLVVGLAVCAVVVGPLMGKGWLQLLDWPTGPTWPDEPAAWSLSAGPVFALLVTVCRGIGGAAAGWLVPAVALVLGATGAARLLSPSVPGSAVAALAFVWNPFVLDRLYSGQVAFLLGYALLPWLADALWTDGLARPVRGGVLWAIAAAASVHLVWLGGLVVLAALPAGIHRVGGRRLAISFGTCVLVAGALTLPWVLLYDGGDDEAGDEQVLDSFATKADEQLGLTLGITAQRGFWRDSPADPADRLGDWYPPIAGAVVAIGVLGLVRAHMTNRAIARSASIAGVAGVVLAHGASGPLGAVYRASWEVVPGFAVMREAQKFAGLVSLATAVGIALFVSAITTAQSKRMTWTATALVGALVVAFTPTLAGGLGGHVEPSRFPPAVHEIRAVLDADDGTAIAMPWTLYSRTVPTDGRLIAAPTRALFGSRVLASDDPGLAGLQDDDTFRRTVASVVRRADGDATDLVDGLRALDIEWIVEVVDPATPALVAGSSGLILRVDDPAFRLWHVG